MFNSPANGRLEEANMQHWEYAIVEIGYHNGWKASYVNGSEIPGWKNGPHMSVYINQRGSEGWELISWTQIETKGTSFGQEANRFHAVMKRPKP
jgi:hypothetical protein